MTSHPAQRMGRAFVSLADISSFTRTEETSTGNIVLTSPELPTSLSADEAVVSWNVEATAGAGIKVEARAFTNAHFTKYYVLGIWSKDAGTRPRQSVKNQKDEDGNVLTDTLVLTHPASKIQLRITLEPDAAGTLPKIKFLGISLADTHTPLPEAEPNRAAWGKEAVVPSKTQLGWPGGEGWCSPTSTAMTLAFWAQSLHRPELDIPVPDAARAIFDPVHDGTGNWPFNTAFAGSFPGIRAYVTRFSSVRELEDWTVTGLPVIVSLSYDALKGMKRENDPGHLMVCDGFDANGDIVLNDPAHHPERSETARHVFPRANFIKAWRRSHNTVYLIYPEGTKLPEDTYGHW